MNATAESIDLEHEAISTIDQVLQFVVHGFCYCLGLKNVESVFPLMELQELPGAPAYLAELYESDLPYLAVMNTLEGISLLLDSHRLIIPSLSEHGGFKTDVDYFFDFDKES